MTVPPNNPEDFMKKLLDLPIPTLEQMEKWQRESITPIPTDPREVFKRLDTWIEIEMSLTGPDLIPLDEIKRKIKEMEDDK